MACSLTPSLAKEDFTGLAGKQVTLKVKGPAAAGVEIVHLRYDQVEVDANPPFQFTLKKKLALLVVLVEASQPGALVQLIEVCGATEQVIDRFHYDPMNPARGYLVRGQ
jgi:hypothetical protein